ncbi:hypothetical protein GCM10023085_58010 [Actinomadura viridis]|uniref:Uncharacterized protein n=1 Tax=Actinomadura viridis TaxID=58110 RepID=A0A931DTT1_9ACTN|nr:hypothetical protein [Actinomadura viridis]MBG6093405.1 hypothetical protein [Actinomadura viridis]
MYEWHTAVQAAEERGDLADAISMIESVAECYSADSFLHNAHLWHMDLLARAGRVEELAMRAETDVHAGRRLERMRREDVAQRTPPGRPSDERTHRSSAAGLSNETKGPLDDHPQ